MQYMGSKARHAREILPIILADRKPDQFYVEPFVGGANMIDKVDGNRIGADVHPHLISLLSAVAAGWVPPTDISEEDYRAAKTEKAVDPKTAFIGFLCSFGAKWFGGYARNSMGTNYAKTGHNALIKQAPRLAGIEFRNCGYAELEIPEQSIIYCDPPYAGTTKYTSGNFDHQAFWQWCEDCHNDGHAVYVSEYSAPDNWECIWQKSTSANFSSNRKESSERIEKLFTLKNCTPQRVVAHG